MAEVWHAEIDNADLHEPKGTEAANAGQVYVFRNTNNQEWQDVHYACVVAEDEDLPTETTITTPTDFTTLGISGYEVSIENGGLTGGNGPHILWNDAFDIITKVNYSVNLSHDHITAQDVLVTLMLNGTALEEFALTENCDTDVLHSFSDSVMLVLSFGDTVTISVKCDDGDITIRNAYINAWGVRD